LKGLIQDAETSYALENVLKIVLASSNGTLSSILASLKRQEHFGPEYERNLGGKNTRKWEGPFQSNVGTQNKRPTVLHESTLIELLATLVKKQLEIIEHHPERASANQQISRIRSLFEGFIPVTYGSLLQRANALPSSPEYIKTRTKRSVLFRKAGQGVEVRLPDITVCTHYSEAAGSIYLALHFSEQFMVVYEHPYPRTCIYKQLPPPKRVL